MQHVILFFALLCMMLSLHSCSDDDSTSSPVPRTYSYQYNVANGDEEFNVVLDSVSSPVTNISNPVSWVSLEQTGSEDGHPVIQVKTSSGQPNSQNTAEVTLMTEDGNTVKITFLQGFNFVPDNNAAQAFLTNWENLDTVVIYSGYGLESVYTPWSKTYTSTTLPDEICQNVKKKDGWEMAFCTLGDNKGRDLNYFGLYNRYLGILRVFYFNTNAGTTASEYSFEIAIGSSSSTNKYPFYNALDYSIPTSHSRADNTIDLANTGRYKQTFKYWATPYSAVSSTALSRGWTAFDIDLSGYVPQSFDFFNSRELITISCHTVTNQSITLAGTISADISGRYSSATSAESSSSGISSALSTMGSVLGDVQNSALAQIEQALTGSYIDVGFYYAGAACNIASFAYDWIMSDGGLNDNNLDSLPGKVELNLTGEIDLKGYINSFSSNQVAPLTLNSNVFRLTNPDTHVGKGVWSLSEDPVVYVVDDHFLGSQRRVNMTVGENHTYLTSDADSNDLRFVTFMDPQSVKVNINTDIFPDVSDVEVVCYYGVYPNATKGFTSNYRNKLLQLETPASIDLVNRSKVGVGSLFRTTNSGNKMAYHVVSNDGLISKSVDGSAEHCSKVKQAGSNYSYYGRLLNDGSGDARAFIIDPQVFFPVSEDGSILYDGEVPDFVVCVFVTFKSGNRLFQFSRRYLPTVKLISGNNLLAKQNELQQYVSKCNSGQPINYLNGGNKVGVKHPNGAKQMEKTMNVLKLILNN